MKHYKNYKTNIVKDILDICNQANRNAFEALKAVNATLVIRNWLIGKRIALEVLTNRKQDYGKKLIADMSKNLTKYEKGLDPATLHKCHKFYRLFPHLIKIREPVVPQSIKSNNIKLLPWSFYLLLIRIDNNIERTWYEQQILHNCWSKRQLERAIKTDVYHRLTLSQTNSTNQLTKYNSGDYLKSLYIFDFLNLNNEEFKESELEQELINNLSKFLFELGSGYSFAGRQIRLKTDDYEYYIDLVFYNINLKRYLIIDLKVNEIKHSDIGQMTLYLNLFDQQYKKETDNESIGMVLSSDLNSDIVRYLMAKTPDHIVASKYLTYLPTKEQLRKEIEKVKLALSKK